MLLAADVTDGMLLAAVCRKKVFLLKDGGGQIIMSCQPSVLSPDFFLVLPLGQT